LLPSFVAPRSLLHALCFDKQSEREKYLLQTKKGWLSKAILDLEAAPGFEPGNRGFADRCLTTWLCRQKTGNRFGVTDKKQEKNGAGNGI
jgi:hypothetical protein